MRIPKITFEIGEIGKEDAEPLKVVASLRAIRTWEAKNAKPFAKHADEGYLGWIVELAHIAYRFSTGSSITIEDFEERFDIAVGTSEEAVPAVPSDPATAPQSG